MNKNLILLLPAFALGSCAKQHLVTADKAYDRMAYAKAVCSYEKALSATDDREAALRAADAYRRINELPKAGDWYAYAERTAPLTTEQAMRYAQVLQSLGRTTEAAGHYDKVLAAKPDDRLALEGKEALEARAAFYLDTTLFTVTLVQITGMSNVFSATPYKEGLVFAGEKAAGMKQENPWTGLSFLDLYSASKSASGAWSAPVPLPGDVNGRFHEGPAVFSADGKSMYFTRSDYYKFRLNKDGSAVSHLKLFRADLVEDGTWGNIHQFAYNGDDHSTGHAALSADGNTLYFISDGPGGLGGTDLYSCTRVADAWSAPINLGPTVNTPGNEMFPTVKGDTLFFASSGHRTIGGLDIFLTTAQGEGWSTPENLNYPINTPFDDFALVMAKDNASGYLSSNRTGHDQVHSFTAHDPTLTLEGIFRNDETDEPMAGVEVQLLDVTTGEEVTFITGPDGTFSFPLKKDHDYRVKGGKDPMFTESRDISTKGQRTSRVYREEFDLKEVVVDKPIVVENIYYDYDRWDIRPEAATELNKLVRLFNDNPNLSFELSSHTDSRATDVYNLVLSEARAKSAVDYLIRSGVNEKRIVARGYGEKQLVNRCKDGVECTEDEHQANRRTEFRVTKVDAPLP